MRAVRYHRHGGPDVLQLDEVAVPEPGAGQVLIQAEAIGANAIDTVLRRGNSPWDRPLPGTLTGDVVGRIVKLGPGTPPGVAVGRRVSALTERLLSVYYCYHPTFGYKRSPSIRAMLE